MVTANDSIIINGNKFISSGLGEEMMLMNLETGNYLGLNEVSADIYRQAEEQTTVNNIIDFLLKKYEVEEEVCKTQVLTCINDMLEKEVLVKI